MQNIIFEISAIDPTTGLTIPIRMSSVHAKSKGVYLDGHEWKSAILAGPVHTRSQWGEGKPQPMDVSYGQISFSINAALGNLDATKYVFDGALGTVWYGRHGDEFSDYIKIWSGKLGPIERESDQIAHVSLLGPEADLNRNLLSATFAGTGGIEGTSAMLGVLKPWSIGVATNVDPVLIDPIHWIYQVRSSSYAGPTTTINAVYENALILDAGKLVGSPTDYASLRDLTLVPGEWACVDAAGLFRLGAEPTGKITADIGTSVSVGSAIREMLKAAGVSTSKISASVGAVTAPAIGLFYREQKSIIEAIREAALSAGKYLVSDASGKFYLGSHVSTKSAGELRADRSTAPYVRPETIKQEVTAPPAWRVKVGHTHVFSTHSGSEISPAIAELGADLAAAQAAAEAAQDAANLAAADATFARARVTNQALDSILDRTEKLQVIQDIQGYTAEKVELVAAGTSVGNTAQVAAYQAAYSALISYLDERTPSWTDTSLDTPIDANYAIYRSNYLTARTNLRNANFNKAKAQANWDGVADRPTNLTGLDADAGDKLDGIQDGATHNRPTWGQLEPQNSVDGDYWADTSSEPPVFKIREGGEWRVSSNLVVEVGELTDGPALISDVEDAKADIGNLTTTVVDHGFTLADLVETYGTSTAAAASATVAQDAAAITNAAKADAQAARDAAEAQAALAADHAGGAATSASIANTAAGVATSAQTASEAAAAEAGEAQAGAAAEKVASEAAATSALTAAGAAAGSSTTAAGHASTSSIKADEAAGSATAAAGSATIAGTKAGESSVSAGQSASSATNAAGSASSAASSASVSASARDATQEILFSQFPANLSPQNRAAYSMGPVNTGSGEYSYHETWPQGGYAWYDHSSQLSVYYHHNNCVPRQSGHRYRATCYYYSTGADTRLQFYWIGADDRAGNGANYVNFIPVTDAYGDLRNVPGYGWYKVSTEFDANDSAQPYIRPQLQVYNYEVALPDHYVTGILIEDITAEYKSLQSANAAATSASNAAASQTAAGSSATAASTAATNASTDAATASTKATEASTSATNAAGSASSASSSASVSVTAKQVAVVATGNEDFTLGLEGWSWGAFGDTPLGGADWYVSDGGFGWNSVLQHNGSIGTHNFSSVKKYQITPGRKYEFQARWGVHFNGSSGNQSTVYLGTYNFDGTGAYTGPSWFVSGTIATDNATFATVVPFEASALNAGTQFVRIGGYPNFLNGPNRFYLDYIRIVDVTEREAANAAATAAATSASTADAKATAAGEQAVAAQTQATNAATSAGQALTYRNDASSSATDAAGSASTATTQAGVAATARDAARLAAQSTVPDNFTDPSNWANYGAWGGTSYISGGIAHLQNGGSIHSIGQMPVVMGETYRLTIRHRVINQGGGLSYVGVAAQDANGSNMGAQWSTIQGAPSPTLNVWTVSTGVITAEAILAAFPTATHMRALALLGYNNTSDAEISLLRVENVTSEIASGNSATAAATSASTAEAKATAAGEQATAAQTSATNASTSAGQALTYRNDAATSATNAEGFAGTASTNAGVAVTARDEAREAFYAQYPAVLTPEGRGSYYGLDFTRGSITNYAEWPTNYAYNLSNPLGATTWYFGHKKALNRTPGRRLRATAWVYSGPGSHFFQMYWTACDNDDRTGSLAYLGWDKVPAGAHTSEVLAEGGWYKISCEISTDLTSQAKIFPALYAAKENPAASPITGVYFTGILIEDVTESAIAAGSASAAAGSASSASASQTAASESASAASASATTATTKAGEASTSATQASTSESNAAGSATSAASSATVSATARDAAQDILNIQHPSDLAPRNRSAYVVPPGADFIGPSADWPQPYLSSTSANVFSTYEYVRFAKTIPVIEGRRYRVKTWVFSYNTNIEFYLGLFGDTVGDGTGSDAYFGTLAGPILPTAPGFHLLTAEFSSFQSPTRPFLDLRIVMHSVNGQLNGDVIHTTGIELEDITSEYAAGQSASAAATSASNAGASQTAAGSSASAAATSATNAATSASDANTYATQASTSATNAAGSQAAAATSAGLSVSARDESRSALYAQFPPALTAEGRGAYFGIDTTLGSVIAAADWPTGFAYQMSNPSGSTAHYFGHNKFITRTPGRRYRATAWVYSAPGSHYFHMYWVDAVNYDGSGGGDYLGWTAITAGAQNTLQAPEGGWYKISTELSADASARAYLRPQFQILKETTQTQAITGFYITGIEIEDITSETAAGGSASAAATSASAASVSAGTAGSHATSATNSANAASISEGNASSSASSASSSAASASASASSATTSATLAASVSTGALNPDPIFARWSNSATVPDDWTFATNLPSGSSIARVAGQNGIGYAARIIGGASQEGYIATQAGYASPTTTTPGWYVFEADIRLDAGSLLSSGVYIPFQNSANTAVESVVIGFSADADNNTGAAIGNGVVGRTYRFRKLIHVTASDSAWFIIYAMSHWSGFGQDWSAANQLTWFRCGLRSATPQEVKTRKIDIIEAQVSTQAGVIAEIEGRTEAYWKQTTNAGSGASTFITARSTSTDGVENSTVSMGASEIHLFNLVDGGFKKALSVQGGNAIFSGGLQAGTFIRLGTGTGWPVALAQQDLQVTDGQTVSFGTNLGNVPKLTFAGNNLAALGTGETYSMYADSLTPTGFVARLRIITPAAPAIFDLTSATTPGTGPTYQIDKGSNADATSGNYNLEFSFNVTQSASGFEPD